MAEATPQTGPPEGSRPVPDPTQLTTDALDKAVLHLERLIKERIRGVVAASAEQHKAIESHIEAERKLCDERDASIWRQFGQVEKLRMEQKGDTQKAVDAALSAQKESVRDQTSATERANEKTERQATQSIEELRKSLKTENEGLRRDIDEMKGRQNTSEGQKSGGKEVQAQQGVSSDRFIAAVAAVAAVAAIVIAIVLGGQP